MRKTLKKHLKNKKIKEQKGNGGCKSVLISSDSSSSSSSDSINNSLDRITNIVPQIARASRIIEIPSSSVILVNSNSSNSIPLARVVSCKNNTRNSKKKKRRKFTNKRKKPKRIIKINTKI